MAVHRDIRVPEGRTALAPRPAALIVSTEGLVEQDRVSEVGWREDSAAPHAGFLWFTGLHEGALLPINESPDQFDPSMNSCEKRASPD